MTEQHVRFGRRLTDRIARDVQAAGRRWFPLEREPLVERWRSVDGDQTLRLEYDLGPGSLVVDAGGFKGQWASDIFGRYLCTVHVFEAVPSFAAAIRSRFASNPSITVHGVALGGSDRSATLDVQADSTSMIVGGGSEIVEVVEANRYFAGLGFDQIDLLKVNIEGAEYELLDHLLECGWLERVRHLQVQFHDFVPDARPRMDRIREALVRTHEPEYQYEFIWEGWSRR